MKRGKRFLSALLALCLLLCMVPMTASAAQSYRFENIKANVNGTSVVVTGDGYLNIPGKEIIGVYITAESLDKKWLTPYMMTWENKVVDKNHVEIYYDINETFDPEYYGELQPNTSYRFQLYLCVYDTATGKYEDENYGYLKYASEWYTFKTGNKKLEPYPGTPFTDINSHWGRDYIKWAYEQKLFSGVSETQFAPNQAMNRGMLATVLHRLAGEPTASSSNTFDDVKSGAYYEEAVAWAAENGIVSGTGVGKYAPNQNISREQLAAMLYRYASLNGTPSSTGNLSQFNDVDKISAYALEAMNWAVGEGIITGKGDGRLDPKGNATRAEVATMLQRFAQ